MELNQNQICKGCLVFEEGRCSIRKVSYMEKCPCVNCLIKGMCQEMCDDFDEFIDSIDMTSRTDYE